MKQCFGYVRVSTVKQGEGVSLDAQKEAILVFAERHDISICQWFEEKESAAKRGRPIFNAMVRKLKHGKAEGLVIHKIDRSARNFADWAKIGDLADAGVDIHFATESLDFRSRGGRLTADIQAVIAADYIRNLREETIKGITGRLKQGLYPFKAPIGYLDNGGGKPKTPDPVRAPLVRKLFQLYGSGEHSIWSLVREMERQGLRTEAGKPLSKTGVEKTLRNSFYIGIIKIQRTGQVFQGVHEPLVSAALFERVRNTRAGKCGKKVTKHNHMFRGLFRCALCQSPMTPEKQKGNVYYRCQTRQCITKTVREEVLSDAIEAILQKCQLDDERIERLHRKLHEWFNEKKTQKDIDTTPMQLATIGERLDSLTDKLIDRVIDDETYQVKKQKLLVERTLLENKQAESTPVSEKLRNVRKFLELVKSLYLTYISADTAEKRQIARLATSNRFVSGRNVMIEPQNWLSVVDQAVSVLCGAPARPTSRSSPAMRDQHMEQLANLIKDDEVQTMME